VCGRNSGRFGTAAPRMGEGSCFRFCVGTGSDGGTVGSLTIGFTSTSGFTVHVTGKIYDSAEVGALVMPLHAASEKIFPVQ
jgi:hypothetical protein